MCPVCRMFLEKHVSGLQDVSRETCVRFAGCFSRNMCPVCRMYLEKHPANRTYNPQLHTRPTTCKPKHQVPQAAIICINLELPMMCIMVPKTCWANSKFCNKETNLLHLVGHLISTWKRFSGSIIDGEITDYLSDYQLLIKCLPLFIKLVFPSKSFYSLFLSKPWNLLTVFLYHPSLSMYTNFTLPVLY